jgi:hypothetical protein
MKLVGRIGLVAALAFSAGTFAEESTSTLAGARQVIALAEPGSARPTIVTDANGLDDFAGRYETVSGVVWFVSREGDSLTLETFDATLPTALVRLDARTFATADDSIIVSFKADAAGRVNGLVLSTVSSESTLAASRSAPRRGIVTIQDVREDVARL